MAQVLIWRGPVDDRILDPALPTLQEGGVIACPTETYYALAVDAFQESALHRLLQLKKRPRSKGLLVLLADLQMLDLVAAEVPSLAQRLMAQFWPGPLTLILKARPDLPKALTGGDDTIGVRVSSHPLAQHLPQMYGRPVTGTSANLSGQAPMISASQIEQELGAQIDLILKNSPCGGGLPSTILNITCKPPLLVRAGAVSLEHLEECIGVIRGL